MMSHEKNPGLWALFRGYQWAQRTFAFPFLGVKAAGLMEKQINICRYPSGKETTDFKKKSFTIKTEKATFAIA